MNEPHTRIPVEDLDISNNFMLAGTVDEDGMSRIGPLIPIAGQMTEDQALILAAWLVAMTCGMERFGAILKRVMNT